MAKIPIFRAPFKHPALAKIGVAGGIADPAFLAQVASNTNLLIAQKRHVPPIKQTHAGASDGLARGWTNVLESDGRVLFADVDLTEKGRRQVEGRELRFVSAAFRRDFNLTGEPEGEKLPGYYLDHVALLGDENPAVKQLTDLSEVRFDETSAERAWIVEDDATGEITYFAERASAAGENDAMTIEELKKKNEDLAAELAEEKGKREAAEARIASLETAAKEAKFAEHKADVARRVKAAADAGKLTAEKAIKLTEQGEKAYGNELAIALFNERLEDLGAPAPTTSIPPDPKGATITRADVVAAARGDLEKSEKVSAAFAEAKTKNPELTHAAFIAQFAE